LFAAVLAILLHGSFGLSRGLTDISERARLNRSQTGRYSIYLYPEGWKAEWT